MAEGAGQQAMGYILGKVEGEDENWHGHVTALTVAPDFRCLSSPTKSDLDTSVVTFLYKCISCCSGDRGLLAI